MSAPSVQSDTDIVNIALLRLGHTTIADFDEENAAARIAKATFATIRDAMLEAHPWNFATTFGELSKDAAVPAGSFGYTNAYTIPNNCLRVIGVQYQTADEGDEWRVTADRKLLTNLGGSTIKIEYLRSDVSVGEYSQTFVDALAFRLEQDWAEKLSKSAALGDRKDRSAAAALRLSRSIDGAEGTPKRFENCSFLDAR